MIAANEIGVIFYPGSKDPLPEVELETENQYYNLTEGIARTGSAQFRGRALPFIRIAIQITPAQLEKFKRHIFEVRSADCMLASAEALNRFVNIQIPIPASVTPTYGGLYLMAAKKLGDRRIGAMTIHQAEVPTYSFVAGIISGVGADLLTTYAPFCLITTVVNPYFGMEVSYIRPVAIVSMYLAAHLVKDVVKRYFS
jgi:hypothetical protein